MRLPTRRPCGVLALTFLLTACAGRGAPGADSSPAPGSGGADAAGAPAGTASAVAGAMEPTTAAPVPLLLLISIDQFRGDLIQRYDSLFTGGFRRLLDQGAYFPNGRVPYAASETGPGHATLSTGTLPAHNGIAANDWWVRRGNEWVSVYCVADSSTPILGRPGAPGRSPANLRTPGIADWLRIAYPDARVGAVSGKDRAAILMAGHVKGQVYWFDHASGRFVTSTYYRSTYPDWLRSFERDSLPALVGDSVWRSTVSAAAATLAAPDSSPFEGDGVHTAFPHRFLDEASGTDPEDFYRWVGGTPFVDAAVLALAREEVRSLGLGADSIPDYLAVGLSQTDYVGHDYGPESQEQLDNLLRLDRELGVFFRFLDDRVGAGRWIAAVSADHGVLTLPERRVAQGEPGRRVPRAEVAKMVQAAEAAAADGRPRGAAERAARAAEKFDFIADAMTYDELRSGEPADSFIRLFRNSYVPGRPTGPLGPVGVELRTTEGTLLSRATGTSHGTPYLYDRWIPVLFLGEDILPTFDPRLARSTDVAPTLAALGGIPHPVAVDGRVLDVPRAKPAETSGAQRP